MSRHNFPIVFPILFTLSLAACGHHDNTDPSALNPVPPVTSPMANAPSDNSDTATALAAHTSQYAHEISPLLKKSAGRPTTAPSVVQWIEPAKSPDDSAPPNPDAATVAAQPSAAAPQRAAQSPAAESAAILASSKSREDTSLPLILPESADRLPDPSQTAVTISTDEYEKKLTQLVHDYPRDMGNQINYQLLRFVRDEPSPDLESLASMPGEDREVLSAVLDGLNNFRNIVRADNNLLLSRKIQPMLEMADRLRSQSELTIPSVALCTEVKTFGVYTPLATPRFTAGSDKNLAALYCEVANFTSIQNAGKIWETRLKLDLVLYTETGLPVWPEKSHAQLFVDQARVRRHDFFVAPLVKFPANLTIGRYLLKVTLTDEQSNRVAEATTPVEIVAQ